MKVLLSAVACAPHWGSEPGAGWSWAWQLSRDHEVHVLTSDWSRELIEAELTKYPRPSLTFHHVPSSVPKFIPWAGPLGWLRHYVWQWWAFQMAQRLHRIHRFDVVHHVTFVTWRIPSFMGRLGIPFIWGPIGGGQNVPHGFLGTMGIRGAIYECFRRAAQQLSRIDPFVHETMRRASIIFAANRITRDFLPTSVHKKTSLLLGAVSIQPVRNPKPRTRSGRGLGLLWVGHISPLKALPLLLQALTKLPSTTSTNLTVIGEGSQMKRCRQLAHEWGVDRNVTFLGSVPYDEMAKHYSEADVVVFTSLRDTTGNVILEAMSMGLPLIVLDWAGPGDLVTPECAVKILPLSQDHVVRELAHAIQKLAEDPALRHRMGEAALRRLEEFDWVTRSRQIGQLYAKLVAERGSSDIPQVR